MRGWATGLALWLSGCSAERTCEEQVHIEDGRLVCARVAQGGEALRKGLVGSPTLRDDEGLLLRYPVVSKACITMKGMEQPIDAWFLDEEGRVLRTACGLEPDARGDVCQSGTKQVLEMSPHAKCHAYRGRVVDRAPGLVGPVAVGTLEGERCDGFDAAPVPAVDGRLHLVVHRSELVSEATVHALLERAQAYYAPYGLWLTVDEVRELPPAFPAEEGVHGGKASDALLAGTRLELNAKVKAAGLPEAPSTPEEQAKVDAVVQELVMGPYKRLVGELAREPASARDQQGPDGRIHVVFLQDIARPGSLGEALFQELRGLTVSPWLQDSAPEESTRLLRMLDLPERFVPVAVVGIHPMDNLGPSAVDVTLAHELGHALGLPHVEGKGDLMQDGIHRCVPPLRPEQAGALRGHERL